MLLRQIDSIITQKEKKANQLSQMILSLFFFTTKTSNRTLIEIVFENKSNFKL